MYLKAIELLVYTLATDSPPVSTSVCQIKTKSEATCCYFHMLSIAAQWEQNVFDSSLHE